jgi:hypothetical protein
MAVLFASLSPWELFAAPGVPPRHHSGIHMRSALLWLIGVPIPIIIILWLFTGHA